ncbi:unnamed protein product [Thlaspi arvense]|uniref:DUF8040 domain-containing protein n=1 Tax=Thlaspi arvense TaxID=13288 RepID=A0AAU9S1F9_THLAR|nr:unnamed protein product [Thlaspi arvense]
MLMCNVGDEELYLEDDEAEMDIMLFVLENTTRTYVMKNKHIERPLRQPITRTGYIYIQKALKEDPEHFRKVYRMYPTVFVKLCELLKQQTSLTDTRHMCLEEMVATFLLTIGQNSRYSYTMDTFKRSKFAASTNFHKVLRALNSIAPSLMAKPGLTVPAKIRESTRYYPYFKFPPETSNEDSQERNSEENGNAGAFYEENGDVGTLQSQQREYANKWRDSIAANIWAEATQTGSLR